MAKAAKAPFGKKAVHKGQKEAAKQPANKPGRSGKARPDKASPFAPKKKK